MELDVNDARLHRPIASMDKQTQLLNCKSTETCKYTHQNCCSGSLGAFIKKAYLHARLKIDCFIFISVDDKVRQG